MLDYTEYTIVWCLYLLAMVGLLVVWWRITRPIPWTTPKQLLRVLLAAPLLIPAPVAVGTSDWAPAIFVLLFDMTLVDESAPLRALPFLIYALILGLLLFAADALFRYWRDKKASIQIQ